MTASLPQLRDLWIIDADGHPLVSGTVFPMPQIDLSDRDYFKVHQDNQVQRPLCQRGAGRARHQHHASFAISRKREINGTVRRRHHRVDLAGLFQRLLFAAAAAEHRRADARRRRGARALSGVRAAHDAAAARCAVHERDQDATAVRASSARRPRSTAGSASSRTAKLPSFYVTAGVEARRRHARLDARHVAPSDLRLPATLALIASA